MISLSSFLPTAIAAAEAASKVILEVYNAGDFQAEEKGDKSPLTVADKKAHSVIEEMLKTTNLPILSEEGKAIPHDERKKWEYFWLVDPLDGTKEFLKRNGEFTVNIALIHQQKPVLGVVAVPVSGEVFYAVKGGGVWKKNAGGLQELPKRSHADPKMFNLRVVASRSHMNLDTEKFIGSLKEPVLISQGSSLKFLLLAEGKADIYPRFAPTMEWDTAAAHAIVKEAGLHVYHTTSNTELVYNKPDLLNPHFIVK